MNTENSNNEASIGSARPSFQKSGDAYISTTESYSIDWSGLRNFHFRASLDRTRSRRSRRFHRLQFIAVTKRIKQLSIAMTGG
jgi:hypothetical protein